MRALKTQPSLTAVKQSRKAVRVFMFMDTNCQVFLCQGMNLQVMYFIILSIMYVLAQREVYFVSAAHVLIQRIWLGLTMATKVAKL